MDVTVKNRNQGGRIFVYKLIQNAEMTWQVMLLNKFVNHSLYLLLVVLMRVTVKKQRKKYKMPPVLLIKNLQNRVDVIVISSIKVPSLTAKKPSASGIYKRLFLLFQIGHIIHNIRGDYGKNYAVKFMNFTQHLFGIQKTVIEKSNIIAILKGLTTYTGQDIGQMGVAVFLSPIMIWIPFIFVIFSLNGRIVLVNGRKILNRIRNRFPK